MNRIYNKILTGLIGVLSFSTVSAQSSWSYDFGTRTQSFVRSGSTSANFFTLTPSGGGVYRVRVGSGGGGGGLFVYPLTGFGTSSVLQINANKLTKPNKFSVYKWNNASLSAYVKFKLRISSTSSGRLSFMLGNSNAATNEDSYTENYENSFAGFAVEFNSTGVPNARWYSGSNKQNNDFLITKDVNHLVEVYANNRTVAGSYNRSGVGQAIGANSWHLYIDNRLVVTGTTSGLVPGDVLDGFAFSARQSSNNGTWLHIDDLEYGPKLPGLAIVSSLAASSINYNSATLKGIMVDNVDYPVSETGFVYSVNPNFLASDPSLIWIQNVLTGNIADNTPFSSSITGLDSDKTYYYRAYARQTVSGQVLTSASAITSFTANKAPELKFLTAGPVDFGNVYNDVEVTKPIQITGLNLTDSVTLTINNDGGTKDYLFFNGKETLKLAPELVMSSPVLYIRFVEGATGTQTATLSMNQGTASSLISLTGLNVAPAILFTALPPSNVLDFGTVIKGNSKTIAVPIDASSLSSEVSVASPTGFSVNPTTITSATTSIDITFTPVTHLPYGGTFIFTGGGMTYPRYLSVTGLGELYIDVPTDSIKFGYVALNESSAPRVLPISGQFLTPRGTLTLTDSSGGISSYSDYSFCRRIG